MKSQTKKPARKTSTRAVELRYAIEEDILLGRFEPGQRLDEQSIAERFGISRTPVREALRHLAASGLVDMEPNRGAVVSQPTISELIEMFQVMAELEGLCARLAARRISADELMTLRETQNASIERVEAGDASGFYDINIEFHEGIYTASRNRFLIKQTKDIRRRVGPYRRYITYQPGRMADSIGEHEAILEAIATGDGDKAHDLMRHHINVLGDVFWDFISSLRTKISDEPIASVAK